MVAFLLGIVLMGVSGAPTDDLDACLQNAPIESEPPISWESGLQQMWTSDPVVPPDSIRAYLSQIRGARRCFLSLDPSTIERPYLGNILRTYYVEAVLLAGLRRFPEAFEQLDEAYSYLSSDPPIPSAKGVKSGWTLALHRDRGLLHYLLGNLSSAIDYYLTALRKTPKDDVSQRITFLLDVGLLHQRTQDYSSADHYFQRTARLLDRSDLPVERRSSQQARLLHYQADLLLEKTLNTSFDRSALQKVKRLAQRSRSLAAPGTERYARVSIVLSESLGYLESFEEAYRLNEEVRQYARAEHNVRLQTFALLKLGVLHVQTKRWTEADSILHRALDRASDLGDLDYQRRTLRALGRLHEMQKQWAEAEQFYRKGIDAVEEYRESLTASQWAMTAFAQWRDIHRGLVRTLLAQHRDREALVALDRSRARHLQDLRTQARVSNQLPPKKRTRLDSLSRALTSVRNRLGESSLTADEEATLRNREAHLMAARQQLLALDSAVSRPNLDAITDALAEQDRVLVSYFLDNPWPVYDRAPRSVAFVLTPDTLRTVPLPALTQDSVQTHVEAISPLFTSRGKPKRANAMHFDLRPLHRLHDALYAPVRKHLPENRSLTVIPNGPLFHFPFSMLVRSMPGGRYDPAQARYVLHDRPIGLELSSSLVVDTARRSFDWSRFEPQIAAYGVSDFDTLRTIPSALRTSIPESLTDSTLALPSLPGVKQELRALRSTVPSARVALNQRATEASFCRSVRKAGVVHVASHAFVNASSPLQNAILLRPDRSEARRKTSRPNSDDLSSGTSDGVLFLHELQGQRTHIPMVVLSGCSTASGTLRGGEGMEGLQYAFRAMGAQSTFSMLWPVSDQASVELMKAFYQNLQDGQSKDVALQQAQLRYLREHPEQASPFFWAPPVLYGSPAPLPIEEPLVPRWAWWMLGGTGLLAAGLFLWWMRSRRPAPLFS